MKLVSCLGNSREEHMITLPDDSEDEDEDNDNDEEDDDDDDEEGSEEEAGGVAKGSGGGGDGGGGDQLADGAAAAACDGDGVAPTVAAVEDTAAVANGVQSAAAGSSGAAPVRRRSSSGGGGGGGGSAQGECCAEDGCSHGVQEHSLGSGAKGHDNPVAALPGLVLEPSAVKAAIAFMDAQTPAQAVLVRELPLLSDAARLQLAFGLWAEGLASCVSQPGSGGGTGGGGGSIKSCKRSGTEEGEHTATSCGKSRLGKKPRPA